MHEMHRNGNKFATICPIVGLTNKNALTVAAEPITVALEQVALLKRGPREID
jgi:hypothetical protein